MTATDRRQFLKLAGAGAAGLAAPSLAGCSQDEADAAGRPSIAPDAEIELVASYATVPILSGPDTDVARFTAELIAGEPGTVKPSDSFSELPVGGQIEMRSLAFTGVSMMSGMAGMMGRRGKLGSRRLFILENAWEGGSMMPMPHPMHLHRQQFQVVRREAGPRIGSGYSTLSDGFVDR